MNKFLAKTSKNVRRDANTTSASEKEENQQLVLKKKWHQVSLAKNETNKFKILKTGEVKNCQQLARWKKSSE